MDQAREQLAYGKKFARRFALDPAGVTELADGLQALQISIRVLNGVPVCYWRVFVDEQMLSAMPSGEGYRLRFEMLGSDGFLSFLADHGKSISDDVRHELHDFNFRVLISSPNGYTTATIERYRQRLVPGVGAISFFSACDLISTDPITLFLKLTPGPGPDDTTQLLEKPPEAEKLGYIAMRLPADIVPPTDGLWDE